MRKTDVRLGGRLMQRARRVYNLQRAHRAHVGELPRADAPRVHRVVSRAEDELLDEDRDDLPDEIVRNLHRVSPALTRSHATMPSATAFTTYLLFTANLVNQMGRVLVPAIKTTVLADAEFGAEF